MARAPIQIETRDLQVPRERIWKAISQLRAGFTVHSVQDACMPMVSFGMVRDYITDLVAGGYVVVVKASAPLPKTGARSRPVFDQVKRSANAPRLAKRTGQPVTQGMGALAMWRAMKVLKTFTYVELAQAASLDDFKVAPSTAKVYVNTLNRAGYLACVQKGKPGTPGRFRLSRNTGPHAPAITRLKVVFDRNVGELVQLETPQEVVDGCE